jgi:predicted amidohydrolase
VDKVTVACVQMKMRLPQTFDEYREDLRRFTRSAGAKQARLIIFPELAGAALAVPLLRDRGTALLRRAEAGRRRSAGFWQKAGGAAAGALAALMKVDLQQRMNALLDLAPNDLWQAYVEVFGGLAREQGATVVGPSAYLPDPDDGAIYNLASVFGPGGELLGQQAKVMGSPTDEAIARRGRTWDVIPTEVGRLGLMLGSDVLYPEVGRLLAYQGAEALILQGACPQPAYYNKLRSGVLARMQDNQLFAAASFLVGANPLPRAAAPVYQGKSAVFAPQELTPRFNGVLVEMGSFQSEGVLTAEWDFVALKQLWESSETPVRRALPPAEATQLLAALYTQLRALPQPSAADLLAGPPLLEDGGTGEAAAEEFAAELSELPVLAVITSQWPLPAAGGPGPGDESVEWAEIVPGAPPASLPPPSTVRREDETDEMDAINKQ